MPRTPARFTQADLARAIRAIRQSGEPLAVEIKPDGTMRIEPASAAPKPAPVEPEREIVL